MDSILTQFLTMPMLIFCLVVAVLVWTQRRCLELAWPKIKENKIWRELFLPIGPPGTGAILGGLIVNYPFPETLTSLFGRIFCGVVCGLASGTVYRILKKFLNEKLGTDVDKKDSDDLSKV